jgi:hypothetical protein
MRRLDEAQDYGLNVVHHDLDDAGQHAPRSR